MTRSPVDLRSNAVGTWVSVGHPAVVEAASVAGFNLLLIDTEHTSMSLETVENLVRTASAARKPTGVIVRVPSDDPVRIKRVLDIGVDYLMVPMVDTLAEAEDVVNATRFPPAGVRGVASGRASLYGDRFEAYIDNVDFRTEVIAQIESPMGVENAASIAAVQGIDGLFVGPADLSKAMGIFADWENPELTSALDDVVEDAHTAGVPVGTFVTDIRGIDIRTAQGFDYLVIGKDMTSLIRENRRLRNHYTSTL